MVWQLNLYLFPLILATIISAILTLYGWNRRSTPNAKAFFVLMLSVTWWCLTYTLQVASPALEGKVFWANMENIGSAVVPAAWLVFCLTFTGRGRWLTRRNIVLLAIEPALVMALGWTNPLHHLFRSSVGLDLSGPISSLTVAFGPAFWLHILYSYLLTLIGTAMLFQAFLRVPRLYRRQVGILLIGSLIPWLANVLPILGLNPLPFLALTPFAFVITGAVMAWGIFRFQLLDVKPAARDLVIENMDDGVLVLDREGRVVDLNAAAARLIGGSSEELIGLPCEEASAKWPGLSQRLSLGILVAQDELVHGDTASTRHFALRVSPLNDVDGSLAGRVVVLQDITERKQAEKALALARDQALEMSRLKTELLANVSHDLRTPLNAILGYADILSDEKYGRLTENQTHAAERIVSNAWHLTSVINDMLDQAELEAGRLELETVGFSPRDLVADVLTMMNTQAQTKGLRLRSEITDDVPLQLEGDPQRVQQIMVNLVSNACKFTDQGEVRVKVYLPDETHWAIQVADTGRGVPKDAQRFIFEPFRQVDGSTTREHGGVGLGLSLVQHLVGLMEGEIRLESKFREGSVFTVVLPLLVGEGEF